LTSQIIPSGGKLISDKRRIDTVVQRFPFLQGADESFRQSFFAQAIPIRMAVGQAICDQGAQCSHLALVTSGTARVYKLGENGREITLYRIGAGESCILTASCIVSGRPFPAFAVCEEPIEALAVESSVVARWTNLFPVWRDYLFGLVNDRLGDVISVVEEIAFRRVDRRLASYLLQRTQASGNGDLHVTHQTIASDLGTSREVVSRILKDFEHQGWISTSRGLLRICDVSGLSQKSLEN
jgi:CRP/FNR family transcriptional regulator